MTGVENVAMWMRSASLPLARVADHGFGQFGDSNSRSEKPPPVPTTTHRQQTAASAMAANTPSTDMNTTLTYAIRS